MATARSIVRSGIGGLALGGMLYLAGDTASDLMVYNKLHSQAMLLVAADSDIPQVRWGRASVSRCVCTH
jgi:hypothetical protein